MFLQYFLQYVLQYFLQYVLQFVLQYVLQYVLFRTNSISNLLVCLADKKPFRFMANIKKNIKVEKLWWWMEHLSS